MNSGLIYKATNKINGKSYVGMTRKGLQNRKKHHLYASKNNTYEKNKFHNAIKEFGADSFRWAIVEENIKSSEIPKREVYWMNYYNCIEAGYNTVNRGSGVKGKVKDSNFSKNKSILMHELRASGRIDLTEHTLEGKYSDEKAMEIMKCILDGNSNEDVMKILKLPSTSPINMIKRGKSFRHIITDEDVYKMSLVKVGLNDEKAVIARDLILSGRSLISISEELGVNRSTISRMKRGKSFTNVISEKDLKDMDDIMPIIPKKKHVNIKPEQVILIKQMINNGMKNKDIAKDFGVSTSVIWNIKKGVTFKDIV